MTTLKQTQIEIISPTFYVGSDIEIVHAELLPGKYSGNELPQEKRLDEEGKSGIIFHTKYSNTKQYSKDLSKNWFDRITIKTDRDETYLTFDQTIGSHILWNNGILQHYGPVRRGHGYSTISGTPIFEPDKILLFSNEDISILKEVAEHWSTIRENFAGYMLSGSAPYSIFHHYTLPSGKEIHRSWGQEHISDVKKSPFDNKSSSSGCIYIKHPEG